MNNYVAEITKNGVLSDTFKKDTEADPSFNKMRQLIENDPNLQEYIILKCVYIVTGIREYSDIFAALK